MTDPKPIDWKAIASAAKTEAARLGPEVQSAYDHFTAAADRHARARAEAEAARKAERDACETYSAIQGPLAATNEVARAAKSKTGALALAYVTGERVDDDAYRAAKRRGWAYDANEHGYVRDHRPTVRGGWVADAVARLTTTTPKETDQ